MRVKLSLSVSTLLAVAVFAFGLIIVLGSSLSVDGGEFAISLGVPTIGIYLAMLLIASIFVFRLSQRK